MNSNKNDCVSELKHMLNKRGCRLTDQRLVIMQAVLQNKGSHLSSEEIFDLVRQSHPGIGLATVYRALPLLEKMSLLRRIDLDDGCKRYELLDSGGQLHHHLICMECGAVCEVEQDFMGSGTKKILAENNFDTNNYAVKLYGYCKQCKVKKEIAAIELENKQAK